MNNRIQALNQIKTIADDNQLTVKDIVNFLNDTDNNEHKSGGTLQRMMIYIGGIFIFAGICTYTGMIWDDLNSLARVILSLGTGIIAFIMGLITLNDNKFARATTPLFLIAAALMPTGGFVLLDEMFDPTGDILTPSLLVFGLTTAIFASGFCFTNRTVLLFFSIFFGYITQLIFTEKMEIDNVYAVMMLGVSGLMVAYGISKTSHINIAPFFYFFSGVAVAVSAFDLLHNTSYDVLLIGVAALLIYLSTIGKSRTLLTIGVISLLGYLGYFTNEYFKDIVGWPIAMIIMGFVMIGISVFAVKLGKRL